MVRRPYIEQEHIEDEFRATAYGSRPDGSLKRCYNCEPVGMDGRNDWFRWSCRDCDSTYISKRLEKRTRYYQCPHCDKWHFISSGFFTMSDRKNGRETVPLTQDEYSEELCTADIKYIGIRPDTYYGTREWLQTKADSENYELVSDIEVVE